MIHIDKKEPECILYGTTVELLDDLCNAAAGIYTSMARSLGEDTAKKTLALILELAATKTPENFTKIVMPNID